MAKQKTFPKFKAIQQEKILDLFASGKTPAQILSMLSIVVDKRYINEFLNVSKENGDKRAERFVPRPFQSNVKFTADEDAAIRLMYRANVSTADIAESLGRSSDGIYKRIKLMGIETSARKELRLGSTAVAVQAAPATVQAPLALDEINRLRKLRMPLGAIARQMGLRYGELFAIIDGKKENAGSE